MRRFFGTFEKGDWIKLGRIVASLILMLLGTFLLDEERVGLWWNLSIMLIAFLIVGYDVAFEAIKGLFKDKNPFDEDFLMLIATIGAFSLRAFGPDNNNFMEAVLVMLLFQIGELFEDLAERRSQKAITDAVGLRAPIAHLVKDNECIDIKPEKLEIGDMVLVKVGEIIPADGVIEDGDGYIDMSSLTGEPVPESKIKGDSVSAGTILRKGSISIRVSKDYENSTVSKILRLVEEGSSSKSRGTRFVDKFAKFYTPIVVGLAILVAVVPPLFIGISSSSVWVHYLYIAICFLVISCPCAIVISVPLSYFAGLGLASKNGILIKGAGFFDELNRLGTLVSDKTGTLTYGAFEMRIVHPIDMDKSLFLEYLKAAESRSNHPVASAILGNEDCSSVATKVSSYSELAGLGTKCSYLSHSLLAGNDKLLAQEGVSFEKVSEPGSVVYLSVDGKYAGYVVCQDVVRKESKGMVEGLKSLGIKTCLLSGDKEENVNQMAKELGIEEHHSELLPEGKSGLLKSMIDPKGKAVGFIGDGINDAPSIALADVGFAMGGIGSDLAVDNADVVIMNDDLKKVVTSVEIAKATRKKVIFNIAFSLIVKIVVMVLSVSLSNFPLYLAVVADTGLTLLLVLNSILLLYKKVK